MPDEVTPAESPDVSEDIVELWEEQPADGEWVAIEETAKPAESFWQRLKKALFGSNEGIEQRLRSLSLAIEKYPQTPANYVLRGELYLGVGEHELAATDFQRALELASAQFEASDWGGIAQAMRDRAEAGLEKALRR